MSKPGVAAHQHVGTHPHGDPVGHHSSQTFNAHQPVLHWSPLWGWQGNHWGGHPGGLWCLSGCAMLRYNDPLGMVSGFRTLGFPECFSTLDGTHIPITCPPLAHHPYYNQQEFHPFVPQAVVDHRDTFTNVSVSRAGSTHNQKNLYIWCVVFFFDLV